MKRKRDLLISDATIIYLGSPEESTEKLLEKNNSMKWLNMIKYIIFCCYTVQIDLNPRHVKNPCEP